MSYDIHLKIEGVSGESRTDGFKDWIDVLSWSWGASNAGSFHIARGGGSGRANFNDLSITKYVDLATTELMRSVSQGTHFPKAHLVLRKAAGAEALKYLEIDFEELMVTSLSTGGTGGEDRLTENITLNFAKFKMKYTEQLETGGTGKTPEFIFSIAEQKEA